jgi:hypothetical protein
LCVNGRIILKQILKKYIHLALNKVQWWALANAIMSLADTTECREFLVYLSNIRFPKKTALRTEKFPTPIIFLCLIVP